MRNVLEACGYACGAERMTFWRKKQFHIANELRDPKFEAFRSLSNKDKRAQVKIGVVDDQVFTPKSNLENSGYKIDYLGDISSVDKIAPYHITLCDLQGVGTALDAKKQGAFIIREIKRNYPEKFVVAYTGGGLNQTISKEAATDSDLLLKKDADIDEWVDSLDGIIQQLLNPYKVWQRQRAALVAREVDTLTILELEIAFVRSLVSRTAAVIQYSRIM